MRKLILFFILLSGFWKAGLSQSHITKNALQLQLEAFGPGSLFSLNFDARFSKKENGLGFRLGIGGTPLGLLGESCNTGLLNTFPMGLNYLLGRKSHLLELGAGGVLLFMAGTKMYCPDLENDFFSDGAESYWYLIGGYRYQPFKKKGLTYRVFISPLIQKDFPVKLWGGASIGYRF